MTIRFGNADDLVAVERMWRALYVHQAEHGLLVTVPEDGFDRWAASMRPALGRFACVFVASRDGADIGFLAGRVRPLPGHYGGETVGYVSDVYVDAAARGAGVGKALLAAAQEWFRTQGVRRLELQVIVNNEQARAFYRSLGWQEELVQMVWLDDAPK